MFNVNEYFEGNVKSLAFQASSSPATIGVMAKGEYVFKTSSVEYMTVITGKMTVLLPGNTEWRDFRPFDTFIVEKNLSFKVRLTEDTSYLCLYKPNE